MVFGYFLVYASTDLTVTEMISFLPDLGPNRCSSDCQTLTLTPQQNCQISKKKKKKTGQRLDQVKTNTDC